jgi:hypothetical protein
MFHLWWRTRRGFTDPVVLFYLKGLFIFFPVKENEPKETARVPRLLRVAKPGNEAAPHAAMRRCPIRSRAHNLTIAVRFASSGRLA